MPAVASPGLAADPPSNPSLWARLRPEWGGLLLGVLCLGGTNGLALAIPWQLKNAVDALRERGADAAHEVAWRALVIAVAAAVQAAIRTASRVFIFNAGRNVEYALRRDLFAHLLRLPPGYYRENPVGDVMSRLTNDLTAVRVVLGPGLLNLANTAMVYATGFTLLWSLSPRLTLLSLIPFPAVILLGRRFTRSMGLASRQVQEQLGVMSTRLQQDLAGIAVIKQYTLEEARLGGFARLNDDYLVRSAALVKARAGLAPLFAVLGGVGTMVILWAGGQEVIAGHLSIGGLVAFSGYLAYFSWPTVALGWILSLWQRGVAAWNRVQAVLAAPAEPQRQVGDGRPLADSSIEATGLTVRAAEHTLLADVAFALAPGRMLAVVGRTGAGKTTLVDAIPRLVPVAPGMLRVGGRDVTELPVAILRGAIGYAPQDPFLFSATIAENIGFGRPGADPEATLRAAHAAGLERDLRALPDGLETLVGERGITLSGGQRQRVALARALAAEPRILLLDDSLSSVDAETEHRILEALRPVMRDRTSVVVSHRVAAVRDADEILVLDQGRVAERGRHDELIGKGGLYAALYREQIEPRRVPEGAT